MYYWMYFHIISIYYGKCLYIFSKNLVKFYNVWKHCIYTYTFIDNMFQGGHVHRARFSTTINPLTWKNVNLRLSEFQFHMNIYLCVLYAEPYSEGWRGSGNQRVNSIEVRHEYMLTKRLPLFAPEGAKYGHQLCSSLRALSRSS